MKTIWKFPLETTDYQEIEIPELHSILSLQIQNDVPTLWVLINDTESKKEKVSIVIIGTGHPIESNSVAQRNFLGTYQLSNGLVFHAFKVHVV